MIRRMRERQARSRAGRAFRAAASVVGIGILLGVSAAARAADRTALCGTNQSFVSFLHERLLGRSPSGAELQRVVSALTAGLPRQEAIREVFRSPEYQGRKRTSAELVEDAFGIILERQPDASERRSWTELAARVRREGLVDGVLAMPEFGERVRACRN